VASMTTEHVQAMLAADADQAVVRHRGKIESVRHNAQRIMEMRQQAKANGESTKDVFDRFLWSFVNDQPILNGHVFSGTLQGMPGTSEESIAMSKALKKLGFKFVGPTTCYSLMQSAGMVLDHPMNCLEGRQALERLQQRPGGFQDRRPTSLRCE
jgi:DNA-3-methyladenine glycosylase I